MGAPTRQMLIRECCALRKWALQTWNARAYFDQSAQLDKLLDEMLTERPDLQCLTGDMVSLFPSKPGRADQWNR